MYSCKPDTNACSLRCRYRKHFYPSFLSHYAPTDKLPLISIRPSTHVVAEVLHPSAALESATLALSTAHFARLQDNTTLALESQKLYCLGLQQLQVKLQDQRSSLSDDTLATCLMLYLYEATLLRGYTRSAQVKHFEGYVSSPPSSW